ncbi:MAG: beta-ketoacyl-ACP synthase III [Erysipelotrichaceae bacterium]
MNRVKYLGMGAYAPCHVLTNSALEQMVETSDDWIYQMTGIKERRIATGENTAQLATKACQQLIATHKIDVSRIRLIIVATFTPESFMPSTACVVQGHLGLKNASIMAFDLNAACTGFVYALNIASKTLENEGDIALVVGSEVLSKVVNYEDRNTCILFGDGAAAMAIEKNAAGSEFYHFANSIPDLEGKLVSKAIAAKGQPDCTLHDMKITMVGREVFKFASASMPHAIEAVLQKAQCSIAELDYIVPHQANIRIIDYVAKKLNVPMEKIYTNIEKYGNTSAASIPLVLAEMEQAGRLQKGTKLVLVGFGAGFTYGATYLEI